MNNKYQILLFDMDGTVCDSDQMIIDSMNVLYDKYRDGHRRPVEEVIYFSGPPIRETLKKEFPELEEEKIFKEFADISASFYETDIFPYENSRDVLLYLKSKGIKLGVVTNKLHTLTEVALRVIYLEDVFDIIVGIDDVKNPKPNGEGILKAIDLLSGTKENSLYIGDNKIDIDSANNAGVDVALVTWGPRKVDPALTPKYKISSYLDLKEQIYGKDF